MGALKEKYYLEDDNGKKVAVVIPISVYNKMIEELEELEDIKELKSLDKAKLDFIPAEQLFNEIERNRKNG
jgi:PHD/YefM family antitoxin component YafN of YafNO toxin-antitoxin module